MTRADHSIPCDDPSPEQPRRPPGPSLLSEELGAINQIFHAAIKSIGVFECWATATLITRKRERQVGVSSCTLWDLAIVCVEQRVKSFPATVDGKRFEFH